MPALLSCDEFLDIVREAGVVDEQELGPFLNKWRQAFPQSRDTGQLAESMLKAGLITSFQKGNLLQGKKRGYIIADKYILLEHLGAGGMGSVWLCQHKVMRRRVAIKVLPTDFAKDAEYLARFHREARAAAALDHPNIVRAFDVDQDDKMHFLVMEYVDGRSFHDIVCDDGPMGIQQAADYISQAAAGLQHAHEAGLVHRDIKPGNLLVDRKGTVKILDMGLALFFQDQGKSLTQQYDANAVLGTAEYLAPEQVVDSHGVDIRADIYSLGLTFFFLLTGTSPYGEEGTIAQKLMWHQLKTPKSVREIRPDVPEGLAAIISKMLAKDRADRYQAPADLVKALTAWAKGTAEPETEQRVTDARGRNTSPATVISKKGPETIRTSEAETQVDTEEEPDRPRKKPKSDPHAQEGKRRAEKGDKEEDSEVRRRSKKKDPSGKQRRQKAAASGFWTRPRLLIAGVGSGLFVGGGVVVLLVVLLKKPASPTPSVDPATLARLSQQQPPQPGIEPKVEPPKNEPPPPKEEKKPEPKDTPPTTDQKKTEGPKKAEAPKKAETPKKTPAKKDDKTDTAKKKPPAEDKKKSPPQKESLADFFPKPGATLFYNVADYATKGVTRQKWDFTDKGVINISVLQYGMLEKDTLLKNGQVKWLQRVQGKDVLLYFRTTATHIETGQMVPQSKTVLWEPVLPLTSAVKETWKRQLPNGDFKDYVVIKFDKYKGKRAVTIQDTVPAAQGGKVVTQRTYVQGMGEVTRSQSLENMPSPPQLLLEARLVEE